MSLWQTVMVNMLAVGLADDSSGTKRGCQAASSSELAVEQKVGRTNDFVKAAITFKSAYNWV